MKKIKYIIISLLGLLIISQIPNALAERIDLLRTEDSQSVESKAENAQDKKEETDEEDKEDAKDEKKEKDDADKKDDKDKKDPVRPDQVEGAVIHKSSRPDKYDETEFDPKGVKKNHPKETLIVDGYEFPYQDLRGNTGEGADFDQLMTVLDNNQCAYVGKNGMNAFFGHYYNLTDNGIFNPLNDVININVDSEVIITDKDGYSRGYKITQVVEFLHPDQEVQFYGDDYLPDLAYDGNGDDMVYIQYCRWDYELGLLIGNIGYRIW